MAEAACHIDLELSQSLIPYFVEVGAFTNTKKGMLPVAGSDHGLLPKEAISCPIRRTDVKN